MKISERRVALVVHGGAGNSKDHEDGCVQAARIGMALLLQGSDGLSAAVESVVSLEDDPRFNAGNGAIVRSDGSTIEMDAAVMDTRGRLGAVCCLRHVRNPVRVARQVVETPHWMLAGEGALQFARLHGFEEGGAAVTKKVTKKATACDTVGAVALDLEGHFAIASSTGGSAPALVGRVGDTPIPGSGFWAGPLGAVAITGIGEQIVPRMLAHVVYESIERGLRLEQALRMAIDRVPDRYDVGIIAVTRSEAAALSNRTMPFHVLVEPAHGLVDPAARP